MTIRYFTTRGDLLAGQFRSIVRNRFLQVFWAIVVASLCYSAVREPATAGQTVGYKIAFCLVMAALYVAVFVGLTFALTSVMFLLRKNTGVLGEHRLSITDVGLVESTVHNESLNRWSAYHRTVSTKGHLFLYVTESQFHIISKKRPLLEGDLAEFEATLREKTKTA